MLKLTLKCFIFPPAYFGPLGLTSGSLHWACYK